MLEFFYKLSWLISSSDVLRYFFIIMLLVLISIIHIDFLSSVYRIKVSKKKKVLFILLFTFLNIFNEVFIDWKYHFLINIFTLPIIIYFIQSFSFNKTIHFTAIISTIVASSSFIIVFIIQNIRCNFNFVEMLIASVSALFEYIIMSILKDKNIFLLEEGNESNNRKSFFVLIVFNLIFTLKILNVEFNSELYIVFLGVITLIFYLVVTIVNVEYRIENRVQKREIENLAIHNKTLALCTENIEGFKKKFILIMRNIGEYLKYEDYDALKNYYDEIISDYKLINKLSLLDPKVINESAIYNIISNKYYLANQAGIKVELEILIDFKKINMKAYELARILGIFLDNAIEATKTSDDKYIYISFLSEKNRDIIKISNTYNDNEEVNLDNIFKKGFSTKEKNTGLGLWKVKQILQKHDNLDLYTYKKNNTFCHELSIYHS